MYEWTIGKNEWNKNWVLDKWTKKYKVVNKKDNEICKKLMNKQI